MNECKQETFFPIDPAKKARINRGPKRTVDLDGSRKLSGDKWAVRLDVCGHILGPVSADEMFELAEKPKKLVACAICLWNGVDE